LIAKINSVKFYKLTPFCWQPQINTSSILKS